MQVELVACTAHGIRLAIAWNVRILASKRRKKVERHGNAKAWITINHQFNCWLHGNRLEIHHSGRIFCTNEFNSGRSSSFVWNSLCFEIRFSENGSEDDWIAVTSTKLHHWNGCELNEVRYTQKWVIYLW